MTTAQIEKLYRVRIDYEADVDAVETIEFMAFELRGDIDVETMSGNAACSPHNVAETKDRDALAAWRDAIQTFIREVTSPDVQ